MSTTISRDISTIGAPISERKSLASLSTAPLRQTINDAGDDASTRPLRVASAWPPAWRRMTLDPFRHQHTPPGALALPLFIGRANDIRGYTLVDADAPVEITGARWRLYPYGRGGYAVRSIYVDGCTQTCRMHRLMLAAPPGLDVDHRNRDSLDNRTGNLRIATASQNGHNSGIRATNRSGYRGVMPAGRDRFKARIYVRGTCIDLGRFTTPVEAALAYNEAATHYLGEFAFINPIPTGGVA